MLHRSTRRGRSGAAFAIVRKNRPISGLGLHHGHLGQAAVHCLKREQAPVGRDSRVEGNLRTAENSADHAGASGVCQRIRPPATPRPVSTSAAAAIIARLGHGDRTGATAPGPSGYSIRRCLAPSPITRTPDRARIESGFRAPFPGNGAHLPHTAGTLSGNSGGSSLRIARMVSTAVSHGTPGVHSTARKESLRN